MVEVRRVRAPAAIAPRRELGDVVRVGALRVLTARGQRADESVDEILGHELLRDRAGRACVVVHPETVVVTPVRYGDSTVEGRGHRLPKIRDVGQFDSVVRFGQFGRELVCSRSFAAPR